jgi:hypothetical protein
MLNIITLYTSVLITWHANRKLFAPYFLYPPSLLCKWKLSWFFDCDAVESYHLLNTNSSQPSLGHFIEPGIFFPSLWCPDRIFLPLLFLVPLNFLRINEGRNAERVSSSSGRIRGPVASFQHSPDSLFVLRIFKVSQKFEDHILERIPWLKF